MAENAPMWRRAFTQLVMIRDQGEWDALDPLSRWLIATRSAVTMVTFYSAGVGGLLAFRHLYESGASGWFWPSLLAWMIVTLGLFIAHGTNNLLNDYTDFTRGIDTDNYFRTQYATHPLAQKFWGKRSQLLWFAASGLVAALSGVFALYYTRFAGPVWWLFGFGALVLLFYTYPLKNLALGEFSIFLIWGPLMVGGVYYVLTTQWSWLVILASLPIGLAVASVNVGKHTDKRGEDAERGMRTLPVVIGETAARRLTAGMIVAAYLITAALIFVIPFFTPVMLLVVLAIPKALPALRRLAQPRPLERPQDYPEGVWPRWYSTLCFLHDKAFSNWFVLALALDVALRMAMPGFWR